MKVKEWKTFGMIRSRPLQSNESDTATKRAAIGPGVVLGNTHESTDLSQPLLQLEGMHP